MAVSFCFGIESPQYLWVWLVVGAVAAAYYLAKKFSDRKERDALRGQWRGFCAACKTLVQRSAVAPSSDKKAWLLAENIENGMGSNKSTGVRMNSSSMKDGQGNSSLEVATIATLFVVMQRRRYSPVSIGFSESARAKAKTLDVELEEGMTFSALMKAVEASLKTATAENADVAFTWTKEAQLPKEGQWMAWLDGEEHFVVRGPSVEEELSFEKCFTLFAMQPDAKVWDVQFVPRNTLEMAKQFGAPPKTFNEYKDQSGLLRSIHEIVHERHSASTNVAIEGHGFKISFQELFKRSAALCDCIQKNRQPGKSNAVVLCMARGEEIGPTFLAILQAGCYVVPVDVNWPQDRITQVVEDADPCMAFVEPTYKALLEQVPVNTYVVDAGLFGRHANAARALAVVQPSDPAVILFTSGSTGKPKGIVLSHGYLTSLVAGVAESKRMTSQTKTLCYHSPTWMPFLDYLFCPLLTGGACLYFPENEKHLVIPAELHKFACDHGATSAGFVPAMLDIFAEEGFPPTLSDVGVGGAPVPSELCVRLLPMMPRAADGASGILYTGYSGTEQGDVTQLQMRTPEDVENGKHESGFMTAGRPHTAQRIAILDASYKPVGLEAIGEVTVAGPGLASGYLNLPEKTAENFLPACEALQGLSAVRSGDLAKWTTSGYLKPVGRRDSMVKVRGARIELGEVEGTVASHPAVKLAIVTVYEDQLVAYVQPAVPADLRQYCKDRLVSYMVPHMFQGLEEVPKLPNGKVNKKALPKPEVRADGAEVVMELDSLGQMRKFTRKAASEDKVLDNVRAILIGIVIHSHAIPLMNGSQMYNGEFQMLPGQSWGPIEMFILKVVRSGGWSSLAFLSGFDDTRAMRPYGLTYREPLFIVLWFLLDFNWTMWYLPVFVFMRAGFCAAHHLGIEKLHILLASQIWIIGPAFIDMYVGWKVAAGHAGADPAQPFLNAECPSHCVCPWQALPWAQTVSHYAAGWWVMPNHPERNSMVGHALVFIPCYWIGFYSGGSIFKLLTKIADDTNVLRRLLVAAAAIGVYAIMYAGGEPIINGFDDRCSSFWEGDSLVWMQILQNLQYYFLNLSMSLLYVVVIAAIVPVHLQYLAKVCFASLIVSGLTPCLLDTPTQVVELRKYVSENWAGVAEMLWVFYVPFLFELVVGAIVTWLLPIVIKAGMSAYAKLNRKA
eukprot:TRINITY_DN8595_c0_g1_i1.p1 TRINITY_DN8595_c0_g1~~TRINITY_DN8595_c0_g1_i1.p1  ORF type:complete len:1181 (-),score=321.68 TRINITY_DN8595_c0_g1_i1:568-4110(-)